MNTELIQEYIEEYLQEPFKMRLSSYTVTEQESLASVELGLVINGANHTAVGTGIGLVDAGFNSLMGHLSEKYTSLLTIRLTDIYFQIDLKRDVVDLKSKTLIKIEFENDRKKKVFFKDRTTSLGFTTMSVLVKAIEFYVNSELLFKRLKYLVKEAEGRSRPDVASKFRYMLSKIVEVTSYQTVS